MGCMITTNSKIKKKIHIDLSERIHQKLRVKAALENISIQKFVESLISQAVEDVEIENPKTIKAKR
jgi:predicted HicB family RNase H-like nuclease